MRGSRIAGFYKLPVADRIAVLVGLGWLSEKQAADLESGRCVLPLQAADAMIENVVGVFGLPWSIAPNFICNGRECLVPLVVEEPSIVAALSGAAAMARATGGFEVHCDESLLIGQIHLYGLRDTAAATQALLAAKAELIATANDAQPRLVARGGGARDIEIFDHRLDDGQIVLAVHVLVDTCDAMGANVVNTICELLAPRVAELADGKVALRILSNLADRSLFRATVRYRKTDLASDELRGDEVRGRAVSTARPVQMSYLQVTHQHCGGF